MDLLTPFHNKQGKLQFPWKPTADRVFIYPKPLPTTFVEGGNILIPEHLREEFVSEGWGILLAVGSGYYNKEGRWFPTDPSLVPGSLILYDKFVPWRSLIPDKRGKKHAVVLCGVLDLHAIVKKD